jgi:hypothetical protein
LCGGQCGCSLIARTNAACFLVDQLRGPIEGNPRQPRLRTGSLDFPVRRRLGCADL